MMMKCPVLTIHGNTITQKVSMSRNWIIRM